MWKTSVDGPAMVRRLNIDGDGQATPRATAVFVHQLDSYRYRQTVLGRDDVTHAQFGENFTLEGLADDEVCIGDRCRIGARCSRRPSRGSPATGSGSGWTIRGCRRCWCNIIGRASTCGVLHEGEVPGRRRDRQVADGPERMPHLSGKVTYTTEPVDPPADGDGDVLICCTQPRGPVILDL